VGETIRIPDSLGSAGQFVYLGEQKMNRRCPMTRDTTLRQAQLEMRWIPVTDPNGRHRMETVWLTPDQVAAHATTHAA
jgi:hypothetical protein